MRLAFHAADTTARLLSWAGVITSAGENQGGVQDVILQASVPRHYLISGGSPAGIGRWLGPELAQAFLQRFLTTAASHSTGRPVTPADAVANVREAITEVSDDGDPRHPGKPPADVAKVVVIIPDKPYDLRKDLGLTATAADAWSSESHRLERESLIARLGLADSPLTHQVAGIIDDVPVIMTRAITRQVAVLNLAKLRRLPPATGTGEGPGEPHLRLFTFDPAFTTASAPTADGTRPPSPPGTARQDPPPATPARLDSSDPLLVSLRAWVSTDIIATEPATARILTWDEWR